MTNPSAGAGRPKRPVHPFWCDDCEAKAPFMINGCGIPHGKHCPRHGEDAIAVFEAAVEWCKATGESIP